MNNIKKCFTVVYNYILRQTHKKIHKQVDAFFVASLLIMINGKLYVEW